MYCAIRRSKPIYGARQICSDEFGQAECYAFGAYAHGKFAGVTNATNKHQELVRYLNFFIQTREKSLRWSSLAVNNNNPLAIHKDVHNLKGELNVLICVGQVCRWRSLARDGR